MYKLCRICIVFHSGLGKIWKRPVRPTESKAPVKPEAIRDFEGGGGVIETEIIVLPFSSMASRFTGEDRHPSFRDEQSREVTKARDALETADWTLETMRRRREQMERSYEDSATEHTQRYREARDKALAVLPQLEPVLKR